MEPRVSVVILGVANLDAATAFYATLGFRDVSPPGSGVALLDGGGVLLGLWDRRAGRGRPGSAEPGRGGVGRPL